MFNQIDKENFDRIEANRLKRSPNEARIDRMFMLVDLQTNEVRGAWPFTRYYPKDEDPPEPDFSDIPAGFTPVEVQSGDLHGLDPLSFSRQYAPVISEGAVTGWKARGKPPEFDISENPKEDGSNVATISLTKGPRKKKVRLTFTKSGIATNLPEDGIVEIDNRGVYQFKLKAMGRVQGLALIVECFGHSSFITTHFPITIDPAAFE